LARPGCRYFPRAGSPPVPVGTAPTVATLADAPPEALHPFPVEERTVSGPDGDVTYRIQGAGNPVVVLGTAPTVEAWDALLGALAADGVLAVGVDLVPTVREDEQPRADLLAVLRDLDLGSATFVGLNGGAVHVAELLAEHSDRADGVVFAGPALPVTPDRTELDGQALLVLTEDTGAPYWDDPERFADGVVEFVRQLPAQNAEAWGQ
jgi:pimeloyl-ACP methyl ester carboxylesterase